MVRRPLEQLEKAGLVKKIEHRGRVVTKEGASILDTLSGEVLRKLEQEIPDLQKYR